MGYKWTTHYVNEATTRNEALILLKEAYDTRFRINELRFKTKELRYKFQSDVLDKFMSDYNKTDWKNDVDALRIYSTPQEKWITQYGEVVLSDVESLGEAKANEPRKSGKKSN